MPLFDFRCAYLPYCIQKQSDGKYAVLNREYKPVGFVTRDFIHYNSYPVTVELKITKAIAKKVSYNHSDNIDTIYLYNDGCVPIHSKENMDSYLKRLAVLAPLDLPDSVR